MSSHALIKTGEAIRRAAFWTTTHLPVGSNPATSNLKGECMSEDTYNLFRLQELITCREGMIAENKQREHLGQSLAYNSGDFARLAMEIRQYAEENR